MMLMFHLLTQGCMTAASSPLSGVTFVAFDVETTGFNRAADRIVEIGGVKFRDGQVVESKAWLVNPGMNIPSGAQAVHGITDAMVADAPDFRSVFAEFTEFVDGTVLLAHNAVFDVGFMRAEIERSRLEPVTNPVLDTLKISRKTYPELSSHSLENLAQTLNLPTSQRHRSLPDAMHVKDLFLILIRDQTGNVNSLIDLAGMRIGP
jgi:DNA polymerase III epsilon subunit family exonuclease